MKDLFAGLLIALAWSVWPPSHSLPRSNQAENPPKREITEGPRAPQPAPALQRSLREAYGKLPLYFIENRGQLDAQVAYYIQGHDASMYFTGSGVTFALTAAAETREPRIRPVSLNVLDLKRPPPPPAAEVRQWAVKLEFLGANLKVKPAGRERTSAVISYFKGQQSDWKTGLATYSSVVYENLWPGIDLVYRGRGNRLKYEFVVQPGAKPEQIKLAYRGATTVGVNRAGQLEVSTPVGGFSDDVPYAYQDVDGKRVEVRAAYALDSEQEYGFRVGTYDRTRPLVLDPVLLYAGYIGGLREDHGTGIAVDSAGNAYVTGYTNSTEATFPVAVGPILKYARGTDAFVAKVNPAGTALVYAGYFGGSGADEGLGIAVDSAGNAYVTGATNSTEATFPVKGGPKLTYNGGLVDAFVVKVNAAGTALVYAGYIGGSAEDQGTGITVDSAGNAYVTGYTTSTEVTFPVTVGPILKYSGNTDAFVAKVNAAGTALVYAGYIGGSTYDVGYGIAVDGSGNAYLTGYTQSTEDTFPVTVGPRMTYNGGSDDAFVAKVNAAGTALVYAGYIGGSGSEVGYGIAVDSSGNAYVTGYTDSTEATFPVAVGPKLTYNGGMRDAFVAKVNAAGTALIYAGYIGGSDTDEGRGIAVDSVGSAYVTGYTQSTEATFPVAVGPKVTYNGGATDAFVAKVNPAGTALIYAGYIGGSGFEVGSGIAVDGPGNAYVAGYTTSPEATFPVTIGPRLTYNGGFYDAFVAKISADTQGGMTPFIAVVSAASYRTPLAPAAIASLFGSSLSDTKEAQLDANGQLPTELAGVSIQVAGQAAQLLFVSPFQVNFVMPASIISRTADIVVQSKSLGHTLRTTVEVRNTAPALFSLNLSGKGPGAILNAVTFMRDPFLVETPENFGDDKRTRLAIYGTGIRFAGNPFLDPSITNVAAAVKVQARDNSGKVYDLPVEFAGAAPVYFGLDQVNIVLPPQLDGAGPVSLTVTAETATSNVVTFTVDRLPDSAVRLERLSLAQSSVSAGSSVNGTVTLNAPARVGGFPVSLSTTSNFVQTPGSVTVPAGQVSADFTLRTLSSGGGFATILAEANGVSRRVSLTVNAARPVLSTLTLSASSITGGISPLTGTVTLSGPAQAGGAQVVVSASSSLAQPPAIVAIPFGQTSATFTIPTTPVATAQMVTITASFGGTAKTATITLNPIFTFTLSPDSVTSGQMVTGTVSLSIPTPFAGANVHFTSSRPLVAAVPQVVLIPRGQTSASVPITTGGTTSVETVTITAEYLSISQSALLTVIPLATVSLAKLEVNPGSVKGGTSATGTVTLTAPAGIAGVSVTLQSSSPLAAQVPTALTIPSGQTTATFSIQTMPVTSSQTVTITASAGGVTKKATLTVQ